MENMFKIEKKAFILILLCAVSFIFTALGTGGNAWVRQELKRQDGSQVTVRGLWKYCSTTCLSYTVTSSYLMACRALTVISSICSFVALCLSVVGHASHIKPYLLPVATMGSVVSMFIAILVYISKNIWISFLYTSYGWTFIIAWLAIVLNLLTAIVSLIFTRQQES
ncbi:claudin domain-containing protein 2-like [Clytia hemisphaerica]|uniref:Uncharacterized protein n=1 Tax=Clytia hemisphaerica TaxID=252671 RepID=A0A7M5XAK6_9CNID|eukprot:TCONS_00072383-protein